MSGSEPHPVTDFELLYERFRLPVYRFVRGMVLDAESAEDLTRQAFERAYAGRSGYREGLSPSAWLHGFAAELTMSHLRRRRIARFFAGRPRGEVDSQVVDEDSRGGVERALAALSPGLRAVALLRLYARLSPEEIGSILGTSSATVSSRLQAATEVMTAALAGGRAPEAAEPR
jgi:RNA polymerase sigma factor (sigma-70 family)